MFLKLLRSNYFSAAIVAIVTAITMYPVIDTGWVNWDDPGYVLENELIRDFSFIGLKNMFETKEVLGMYHPLTILSLSFDHLIADLDPQVYHLHNLVLHVLNTGLVFLLINTLTGSPILSIIVSLLFGIHPMHVEAVAWISSRKDTLFSMYYLLTMVSWLIFQKNRNWAVYGLSLLLALMSLMAKTSAISIPIVLILLDWLNQRKDRSTVVWEKVPFFLVCIGFGVMAISTQQATGAMGELTDLKLSDSLFVGTYSLSVYFIKSLIPLHLSAFHPYPYTEAYELPWYIYASPILVVSFCIVVWKYLKKQRLIVFGLLFYAVTIGPTLQIIAFGDAIIGERFTYMPYIGLFLSGGVMLRLVYSRFKDRRFSSVLVLFGFGFFISIGTVSFNRIPVWKDNISLWTDVIMKYPDHHLAYCNRATSLASEGDFSAALIDCNHCVSINPGLAESYNNRGLVHSNMDNLELAMIDFSKAIDLEPNYILALVNRAVLLQRTGRFSESIQDLQVSKEIDPTNPLVWYNLAVSHASGGQFTAALNAIDRAIELSPGDELFHQLKSKILERKFR